MEYQLRLARIAATTYYANLGISSLIDLCTTPQEVDIKKSRQLVDI